MPYSQITENWDQRFLDNDIPWEDDGPSIEAARIFQHFIKQESKVLEIGCSRGINGIYLAGQGYDYTGIDISKEAINQAKELGKNSNARFEVLDFMKADIEPEYDVIFDKGLFHTFREEKYRHEFVSRISRVLKDRGFWICIAGNSDHPDSEHDVEKYGFPRMSASEIISSVESSFEIHYLARCIYGDKSGNANFLGWACVFEKK